MNRKQYLIDIVLSVVISVSTLSCQAPPPPRTSVSRTPTYDVIEVSFAEPVDSRLYYLEQEHRFPAIVDLDPNLGVAQIKIAVRLPESMRKAGLPGDVKLNESGSHLWLRGNLEVMKVALSSTDKLARYRFILCVEELQRLVAGEVLRKWHFSAEGKKLYVVELGLD